MVQQPSHKVKLVQLLPIYTILRQSTGGCGGGEGDGGGKGGGGGRGSGGGGPLQWAGMLR